MDATDDRPFPTSLSRKQRRVLGVLLEKAFTTPEQYPLTLKATTTGCNQKSNRDPVTNYDEEAVQQTLESLQQIGLIGCLHTEGGRTERYRHYMRHRTKLSEGQLAILTELLLRGKQQLGDLRTRASRMAPLETQEKLRQELQALIDLKMVRSNAPIERRGAEVDHNLYADGENREPMSVWTETDRADDSGAPATVSRAPAPSAAINAELVATVDALRAEVAELREQLGDLRDQVSDLRRQLGA